MNWLFWTGWVFFKLLFNFFRGNVFGRENIPESGAFILASNHISYFDPPFVGAGCKREVFFFAKRELFKNKLIGALFLKVNARPVRRGAFDRGAIETAVEILKGGNGLTVFPEGTRGKKGEFLPVKPGVGMIAHQAEVPIVPTYIHGSDRLWKCFFGKTRLRVTYGEPLSKEYVTSLESDKESYKAISEEIMTRIKAMKENFLSSI
jgi:1-acyl-sn-glycerol-3-phosphate acyltransferase